MAILFDLPSRKATLQRLLKAREKVPGYADNVRELKAELAKIEQELLKVDG